MLGAEAVLRLEKTCAVKLVKPAPVLRKMRTHPVKDDAYPLLVTAVDKISEIVGSAEP